jgi:uncharacterized repeat protein (TIGR03803 family)
MLSLRPEKTICAVILLCAAGAIPSLAQTFEILGNFDLATGTHPIGLLVQGLDGNFYGATTIGGDLKCQPTFGGCGAVFKVSPEGKIANLHSFTGSDGEFPEAGLVLGTDGNFYGTTMQGGANTACAGGCGTIFKITPAGKLTTLHSFDKDHGANPWNGLSQADDGNLYGMTPTGGDLACNAPYGCGTVFKITPSGEFTHLHSFENTDGSLPYGGITQGTDGDLYGTADFGGNTTCNPVNTGYDTPTPGCGTVFKITPQGRLTTLYQFNYTSPTIDGAYFPFSRMVQDANGNFYGTTGGGFLNFINFGLGAAYEVTPTGSLTILHAFCETLGCPEGEGPGDLLLGSDGEFYGVTASPAGEPVFKMSAEGKVTVVYTICTSTHSQCPDGPGPGGTVGLLQATDGSFYGTSLVGGTNTCYQGPNCGTFFRLSVGLAPFVKTVPTSAAVATKVYILGTNLTGASSVTFNGTAAEFTVVSPSEISTTVPTGAMTGKLRVETPQGALVSNVDFQVLP